MCEHRWADSGEHKITTGDGTTLSFIFSGKPAAEDRASGVGLLLTPTARRGLIEWSPISDRIMTARFRCKVRNITFVQVYSPTNTSQDDIKEAFYQQLSQALDKVTKGDILIVMGDLNAKVGNSNVNWETVMGKHGLGTMNENGELFAELCLNYNLLVGGTVFPHKDIHKGTWKSPDGRTVNQIDHITINRRWRRSLEDVRVYRKADIHSDHHLLVGTIQVKLAATKKKFATVSRKTDPQKLKHAQTLDHFKMELEQALSTSQAESLNEQWNHVASAYRQASEKTIPRDRVQRKCYISDETWDIISERKATKAKLNVANIDDHARILHDYHALDRRVKKSARNDRRNWYNNLAMQAQEAANNNNTRETYRLTRKMSNRPFTSEQPVRDKSGKTITDDNQQIERWTEHFQEVLNPPVSVPCTQQHDSRPKLPPPQEKININCPSLNEVKSILKKLKTGKAPGSDGLMSELFKADIGVAAKQLHPIITRVWESEIIPDDWKEGLIIKLPKKGNLSICTNWRGIVLQNTVNKLTAQILLDRISTALEPNLRQEQAGFRRGRSCIDQVNSLRIIVEQSRELNSQLNLLFVDFERAFDSLNREYMWTILSEYGVPRKIINIIKELYRGCTFRVLHRGNVGTSFTVGSGVKQGCILSPLLFSLVIDHVMRRVNTQQRGIQWNPFSRLEDLDYADDLCILSHNTKDMKGKLEDLISFAKDAGLKINVAKTKLLRVNPHTTTRSSSSIILLIDNQVIEEVDEFCYLGSMITKDGGADVDVKNRIQKARQAFGSLNRVWSSGRYTRRLKLQIFNSNIKSVLLYGCETWKVTRNNSRQIQVFVNRCLRKIAGIFYPNIISNENLWKLTKQKRVSEEIGRRKWGWIGHTLRKNEDDIARQAMSWNPPGKRKAGRQFSTWRRTVEKEAMQQQKVWSELPTLARNKVRWKSFVEALRFIEEQ